jgi:hypothetical protein
MAENMVYYSAVAVAVLIALAIGTRRYRRSEEAIRKFAMIYGLNFRRSELFKGIMPEASGNYHGWAIFIGSVSVRKFTKGIGPAETESHLEARLDFPEGVKIEPAQISQFLNEGGGFNGKSLRLFPETNCRALSYDEIEKAFERLRTVAEQAMKSSVASR